MNSWHSSRFVLIACAIGPIAAAQVQFHFGVEAGVPLTDTLSSTSFSSISPTFSSIDQYNSMTKRLLIGPAFRVDLQRGLGIEFDALYQRVNYDHAIVSFMSFVPVVVPGPLPPTVFFNSQSFEQTSANRWQFPLLIQYTRAFSKTRPFVEVGPSISSITNSRSTIRTSTSPTSSSTSNITGRGGTFAGVTAGGGVDLPVFGLHLRPEFRYSHWFSPNTASSAGFVSLSGFVTTPGLIVPATASPSFRTNQNEASFLLGLTF